MRGARRDAAEAAHGTVAASVRTRTRTRPQRHAVALAQPWRLPETRFLPKPDRPGPQSQSISRSYGSVLPTSLAYIDHVTRGCSPWRPAADMGTIVRQDTHCPRSDFQGTAKALRTPQEPRCFTDLSSPAYLRTRRFQVGTVLTKKRQLFPRLSPASPRSVGSPLRPARTTRARRRGYRSDGSGMLTRFPFASHGRYTCSVHGPFGTPLGYSLGSTDPCSTAVHMEPFSTSVFKVLV